MTAGGGSPAAAGTAAGGGLDVFRNRPFLLLWLAQAATQIGGNMVIFGLTVIIAKSTGSTTAVSALILTFLLPAVLFSALAGVFVDRLDRRLVLIATNVLRGLAFIAMFFVGDHLGLIYLLNILVSTITVFFAPAEAAMIPILVPRKQLLSANGIFTLTLNAAFALGFTLIGPLIVKIAGAPILIAIVALLYFGAAAFCVTLPSAPPAAKSAGPTDARGRVREAEDAISSVLVQLREGLQYIQAHREIRWSLIYLGIAASLVDNAGQKQVRALFDRAEPGLTTREAERLQIRELVSEFSTPYSCCQPRVTNIQLAASILDGQIIEAGGSFSLNERLGQRTAERGFVAAPQISDGRLEDAIGGGVSQTATTLYNAAFFAGLELVAHTPHQFYISRYPMGREATVSWGGPELIFRNDWPAAILVKVIATDTFITVRFYSSKLGRRVETETGEPHDFRPARVIRELNPELPPGTETVVQSGGVRGFSVEYTRKVYRGKRLLRDERFSVRYDPEDTIVEYGPPVQEQPAETGEQPAETGEQPAETGNAPPAETKPAETKPAETAPAETAPTVIGAERRAGAR